MNLKFVSSLWSVLARYMVFIVFGGVTGRFLHSQVDYFFVYLCIIGVIALFMKVPVLYNEKVYGLIVAFLSGFWLSLLFHNSMTAAKAYGILGAFGAISFLARTMSGLLYWKTSIHTVG